MIFYFHAIYYFAYSDSTTNKIRISKNRAKMIYHITVKNFYSNYWHVTSVYLFTIEKNVDTKLRDENLLNCFFIFQRQYFSDFNKIQGKMLVFLKKRFAISFSLFLPFPFTNSLPLLRMLFGHPWAGSARLWEKKK